ncbi:MAG TPA: FAD:protein FMN transferase [Chlamydiales bacterium]|nr:FAD:protein FMN transferase [Chlamydiales bacterium]
MTMPYHITVGKNLTDEEHKSVSHVIEKTFTEVHEIFDNWNPKSEISRLNAAPAGALLPLSLPLQNLLSLCSDIVTLSSGRFDPTIEPLEHLWREEKTPSPEHLQAVCDSVGWSHISIHNGIFKKDHSGTKLDLCAVAKGLCIDWLTERLQAMGYADLLVEWAGEMRAAGHHPENRDWTVQINPHLLVQNQPIAPIHLRNNALATSGSSFVIDPLTASPLEKTEYSIAFATVIAPTCALADALATAAVLFHSRREAESWAQEVVDIYPDASFWIISHRKP